MTQEDIWDLLRRGQEEMAENLERAMGPRCGIQHGFGDQTCIRDKGHEGNCRSKAERGGGGTVTYSEWESRDGKFVNHIGYQTIYPANAKGDET